VCYCLFSVFSVFGCQLGEIKLCDKEYLACAEKWLGSQLNKFVADSIRTTVCSWCILHKGRLTGILSRVAILKSPHKYSMNTGHRCYGIYNVYNKQPEHCKTAVVPVQINMTAADISNAQRYIGGDIKPFLNVFFLILCCFMFWSSVLPI